MIMLTKEEARQMLDEEGLVVDWIVAGLREKCLFIPRHVLEKVTQLDSVEAELYFTYKNRYPTFKEVILEC